MENDKKCWIVDLPAISQTLGSFHISMESVFQRGDETPNGYAGRGTAMKKGNAGAVYISSLSVSLAASVYLVFETKRLPYI